MSAIRSCLVVALLVSLGSLSRATLPASPAQGPQGGQGRGARPPAPPGDPDKGQTAFEENCSTCHGVDASGGQGPNIQQAPATMGDAAVRTTIRRGVPGTEMPGFYDLNDADASNIIAYLKKLGSSATAGTVAGDPVKGEAIFKSSGCSACHMINGQGGDIGPELTRIGRMRGPSGLKARLIDPGASLPKDGSVGDRGDWTLYLLFKAVDKNGKAVEGMRMGEDSFSIVLKDINGNMHAFYKPDLRSLEKEPGKSLMPSFQGTLSDADMDDLVAYLASLKGAQ